MYVAIQNVPGYLPMADEPATFDSAHMAWDYLMAERVTDLDNTEDAAAHEDEPDSAMDEMQGYADEDGVGTVYGFTPGYEGDHDLGLAYSVMVVEPGT